MHLYVVDLGLTPYDVAWALQKRARAALPYPGAVAVRDALVAQTAEVFGLMATPLPEDVADTLR